MKEVIVRGNPIRAEIVEVAVPQPARDEVLIKVMCTASNPKDWKLPAYGVELNQGDDIAGYVEAVGADVYEFKKGDRVAAFHEMMQPHGSYAEYAIAPAHTTFHIASTTSFEEAATVPLAAMTSALALHIELGLPTPWKPATKRIPLIIYGGSTAVGAFAIKLAKLANIGPIIAVAGSGIPYVKSLGPDKIVDYREGNVAAALREALGGEKCYHAIDAISETESYTTLGEVLAKPGCTIVTVLPGKEYTDFPEDVEMKVVMVSAVHKATSGPAGMPVAPDAMDFGHAMFRFFARAMADGRFSGHPQTIIEGGLEGVDKGMKLLSEGKASATKYVYRVREE